ncbi:hypothetical protein LRS13_20535 [Svornostia abyssi]|uniref:Uncharacterized protein n=1 Tax=Svornostia abyssi TaxID=2898438 RepID=A0ABY5PED4_9ACTN|nr:hypothetical protein LRS13_20535 [Parviterribacteraceae bacterium J379]
MADAGRGVVAATVSATEDHAPDIAQIAAHQADARAGGQDALRAGLALWRHAVDPLDLGLGERLGPAAWGGRHRAGEEERHEDAKKGEGRCAKWW